MKNGFNRILCVTICAMFAISGFLNTKASAQSNQIGILYGTEMVIFGGENVVVNADGSWTVTGDFVLSFPVDYDYRIEEYMFVFSAVSDGTYDIKIDFLVPKAESSEEFDVYTVSLGNPYFMAGENFICHFFDELYAFQDFVAMYPWNHRIRCATLSYQSETATTTTIDWFEFSTVDGPGTVGDVNRDGTVGTEDVRELLLAIVDSTRGNRLRGVDIDGDGKFSSSDVRRLLHLVSTE